MHRLPLFKVMKTLYLVRLGVCLAGVRSTHHLRERTYHAPSFFTLRCSYRNNYCFSLGSLSTFGTRLRPDAPCAYLSSTGDTSHRPSKVRVRDSGGDDSESEVTTVSGIVITTIDDGDGELISSGRSGGSILVTPDHKTLRVKRSAKGAATSSDPVPAGDSGDISVYTSGNPVGSDSYSQMSASPVIQAMAVGESYSDAVADFGGLDPSMTVPTAAQASAALTPTAVAPDSPPMTIDSLRVGQIYSSSCIHKDGSNVNYHMYTCNVVRWYGWDNGYGYLGVTTKGTGKVNDGLNEMYQFQALTSWYANNPYVDWNPYTTINEGSCKDLTLNASAGPASASTSGTTCPDKLQPAWAYSNQGFGSNWYTRGATRNSRGVIASGVIRHKPGASLVCALHEKIWWSM